MKCENCGTTNDADSKFCKECGQKLEAPAPAPTPTPNGHIKIGELIYSAYKHKEAGRIQDAILACQGALALNEASASAHALLGSLYELTGDIASAIREYERVVALNPKSEAERQKLEDLRSGRITPPPPMTLADQLRPYWPYVAAVVSLFVVLALSLAMIMTPAQRLEEGTKKPSASAPANENMPQAAPVRPYGQPQGQAFPGYQQPYPGGLRPEQGWRPSSPGTAPQAGGSAATRREAAPAPETGARRPSAPSEPPVIVPVIEPSEKPAQGSRRPTSTTAGPKPNTPAAARTTPPEPAGDSESRALRLQREGKYQEAIAAYRESLNRTSDPGRLYQQIALCYQRTGQHNMAIDSYNRAISSYRDQLAAGRDPTEAQRNIRSCEAGIQVSRQQGR